MLAQIAIARVFFAETLADSAKRQIKTTTRQEIDKIIAQIQSNISDKTAKSSQNTIKLLVADIYAHLGEKNKAVELLTKVLADELLNVDVRTLNEEHFLLEAGRIFEQNKLKADSKMKKVLREIISAVDNNKP